jgi:hypothetical protein
MNSRQRKTAQDTLDYIRDMSVELAKMAESMHCETLAHILEAARVEAIEKNRVMETSE